MLSANGPGAITRNAPSPNWAIASRSSAWRSLVSFSTGRDTSPILIELRHEGGPLRHLPPPADRAHDARLGVLALRALPHRPGVPALPPPAGRRVPRLRAGRERQPPCSRSALR